MNDITIRFLDTYEYLKKENIVYTPKGFANEINVSTSLITEICKKRTNAGITPIQNLIARFTDIDANWLLTGNGSMLKSAVKKEVQGLDPPDAGKLALLERENAMQAKIIAGLERENHLLREKVQEKSMPVHTLEPHTMSK